jgi:hypothetical protein
MFLVSLLTFIAVQNFVNYFMSFLSKVLSIFSTSIIVAERENLLVLNTIPFSEQICTVLQTFVYELPSDRLYCI